MKIELNFNYEEKEEGLFDSLGIDQSKFTMTILSTLLTGEETYTKSIISAHEAGTLADNELIALASIGLKSVATDMENTFKGR